MAKKEQTIVEELANAPREGEQAFPEPEKETPAAPPAEETKKEDKVEVKKTETENLPFHKHPDWIKRERKLDERLAAIEAKHQEELEGLRKLIPAQSPATPAQPQWFTNIYGDNPEAWKEYCSYDAEMRKQMKEDLRKELQEDSQKSSKETEEINKYFDTTFEAMREEGKEFDENELMRIAIKYELFTEKGEANLRKAYEVYEDYKAANPNAVSKTTNAKKELAAATVKRTTEAAKREFGTPKDFKGKSWREMLK